MKAGFRFFLTLTLAIGLQACDRAQQNPPATAGVPRQSADVIYVNAKVLTVDANFSIAEAIAVTGDRLTAVGSSEAISAYADSGTIVVDLDGRTMLPGLIDNHMHFVRAARDWYRHVRWDGVTSRAEALRLVAARAAQLPADEWVLVIGGWNFAQFDDGSTFSRAELDRIADSRPLYIQEGYRRGFANTRALEVAGLSQDTVLNGRGALVRSADGSLTGELSGSAMGSIAAAIPAPSPMQADMSLQLATDSMLKMGLTSVYDVGGNGVVPEYYDAVRRSAGRGELNMRIFYSLNGQHGVGGSAQEIIAALQSRVPDLSGLLFAQFGWGESTYAPMRAQPWQISNEDLEAYRAISLAAARNGWQLHEHSMRDEKVRAMLDVFAAVDEEQSIADMRWTIAHTNGLSPDSIARAIDLGLVFAVHSSSRLMLPEQYASASSQAPPIGTIDAAGGTWGMGSDATTVASPNPFHNIAWAVSGLSPAGERILDDTVSRQKALTAHTRTNAYLLFREDHLGSLEAGKLADFIVLDRDYMTVPELEIKDLKPVLTVVGGVPVHTEL